MITYCMNKIKTRRSPGTKMSCFFSKIRKNLFTTVLLLFYLFLYFVFSWGFKLRIRYSQTNKNYFPQTGSK